MEITQTRETLASIPGGHYNVHSHVREIKSNLEENKNKAGIKLKTNNHSFVLQITSKQGILISHGLAALLGTGTTLDLTSHIKKLNTPSLFTAISLTKLKTFSMERGPTFLLNST